MPAIPFNRPLLVGNEHAYIDEALASGKLSGNGKFARTCAEWLERRVGSPRALITPSCTAALEMCAILADLDPGDEVIVPDFAFVSTANAFVLRGAVPVFVDIDPQTLNIDPDAIEAQSPSEPRAIVVIHYGGVACDMDSVQAIARRRELIVVEDAAHSIEASYRDRPLGSIGHLFHLQLPRDQERAVWRGRSAAHEDDPRLVSRAEVIQDKGTDRSRFFRGEVDKYTWQDLGSSYLLSEVASAFLWAQLECVKAITLERRAIWDRYFAAFEAAEAQGLLSAVPSCRPDATTAAISSICCCRPQDFAMRCCMPLPTAACTQCSTTFRSTTHLEASVSGEPPVTCLLLRMSVADS